MSTFIMFILLFLAWGTGAAIGDIIFGHFWEKKIDWDRAIFKGVFVGFFMSISMGLLHYGLS